MKKIMVVVALVSLLGGCQQGSGGVTAPISKATLAAMETGLTAALNGANACLNSRLGPCGDPAVRPKIIADEHKAVDAFESVKKATDAGQSLAVVLFNATLQALVADVPATSGITH